MNRLLKNTIVALGLVGSVLYYDYGVKEASEYTTNTPVQIHDTFLHFHKHYLGLPVFGYDIPIVNELDEFSLFGPSPKYLDRESSIHSRLYLDIMWSNLEIEAYAVQKDGRASYYVDGPLTEILIAIYAGKFLPPGDVEINLAKVDSAQAEFIKHLENIKREKN